PAQEARRPGAPSRPGPPCGPLRPSLPRRAERPRDRVPAHPMERGDPPDRPAGPGLPLGLLERIARERPRPAGTLPGPLRRRDADGDPLGDPIALELGADGEHPEERPPGGRAGVDALAQADELDA